MSNQNLTDRQRTVLEFVRTAIQKNGFAPSIREIAEALGIRSPNGVVRHLNALEKKGWINRSVRKSRSLQVASTNDDEPSGFSLAGVVSAGALMEAIPHEQRVDLAQMFDDTRDFLLRVQGNSMIDAQICDGDFVVVKPSTTASRGDIAIVQTEDGEATVKYWFPEKRRIRLQPANRRMKPIYTTTATVVGIVVGVIRKYT